MKVSMKKQHIAFIFCLHFMHFNSGQKFLHEKFTDFVDIVGFSDKVPPTNDMV